jgi:hypothetical protein
LSIYFPPERYTAKLYYRVTHIIPPSCGQIKVALQGPSKTLVMDQHTLDLEGFLNDSSAQARQLVDENIYDLDDATKSLSKNFHVITFQLDA